MLRHPVREVSLSGFLGDLPENIQVGVFEFTKIDAALSDIGPR
jgi:hypothetical protein